MQFSEHTQCRGKRTYFTRTEAKRAIIRLREHHSPDELQETTRGVLRPYRCEHCGRIHIGHRSQAIKDKQRKGE